MLSSGAETTYIADDSFIEQRRLVVISLYCAYHMFTCIQERSGKVSQLCGVSYHFTSICWHNPERPVIVTTP